MAGRGGESLGIYFVNGMLSAEVLQHGRVVRRWQHPVPVTEEAELGELLEQVPSHTDFKGYDVSLIIAAPPVAYHILTVPAMKKRDIVRYCKWKASTLTEGAHVWSYTRLKGARQKSSLCLHLIPSVYQTLFIEFCKKSRLEPHHLLTFPAVVAGLLEKPDESDGKIEMVVLITDRVTYFIIGTKNAPLFIREVSFTYDADDGSGLLQFGREVKRTILFINRQFAKDIGVLRVRGRDAEKTRDAFREIEGVAPDFDETLISLYETVAPTSIYRSDNMLPFDLLGSRERVVRTLLVGILLALFGTALVGATLFASLLSKKQVRVVAESNVHEELRSMRDTAAFYDSIVALIDADRLSARHIAAERIDPLGGYFIAALADAIPAELALSRLSTAFHRASGCWEIEIEGICPDDPVAAAGRLAEFERILRGQPIGLTPVETWHIQWITNLREGGGNEADPYSRRFRITGRLR